MEHYGIEEVELHHEEWKLDAAGALYESLAVYEAVDPAMPSHLSVDTLGCKMSLPMESTFKDALESNQSVTGERERECVCMDENLCESEEEMELGAALN